SRARPLRKSATALLCEMIEFSGLSFARNLLVKTRGLILLEPGAQAVELGRAEFLDCLLDVFHGGHRRIASTLRPHRHGRHPRPPRPSPSAPRPLHPVPSGLQLSPAWSRARGRRSSSWCRAGSCPSASWEGAAP